LIGDALGHGSPGRDLTQPPQRKPGEFIRVREAEGGETRGKANLFQRLSTRDARGLELLALLLDLIAEILALFRNRFDLFAARFMVYGKPLL